MSTEVMITTKSGRVAVTAILPTNTTYFITNTCIYPQYQGGKLGYCLKKRNEVPGSY